MGDVEEFIVSAGPRLVEGLQVLAGEGVMTSAGHLSVRVPGTDCFLINPRYPGLLAEADDLCIANLQGIQVSGRSAIPSETLIHAAIYVARPDVASVLHSHPRNAVLVGLLDEGLIPIHREAACFDGGVPVFPDSRNITSTEQASEMVRALGQQDALFLCGHGIVVADTSIEATCTSAVRLEQACEDQLTMMSVGAARPLAQAHGGRVTLGKASRGAAAYRNWPHLLCRHGLRSRREIKSSITPPEHGRPAPP